MARWRARCRLELSDDAGAWRITAVAPAPARQGRLDWRAIRIPPDAASGTATLRLGGWAVLARYRVEALPLLTEPPAAESLDEEFPGVGDLVGYTLSEPPFSRDNPPQITLVCSGSADQHRLHRHRPVDQPGGRRHRAERCSARHSRYGQPGRPSDDGWRVRRAYRRRARWRSTTRQRPARRRRSSRCTIRRLRGKSRSPTEATRRCWRLIFG
ncbi:MAG: hypothetical protein U0521_21315 [Anaerolineae bacterium]